MMIGLVPGSFKPYHVGHDLLIRRAIEDNDEIKVFASTLSRERKGEFTISGEAMKEIMDRFVKPYLKGEFGDKIEIVDVGKGSTPISEVYATLELADAQNSDNTFRIYSDSDDIKRYTDKSLIKSAPNLYSQGKIELVAIPRTETINVSGTEMRKFLQTGEVKKFSSMLPPAIQNYGQEIFDILKGNLSETLLKKYIKQAIKNL